MGEAHGEREGKGDAGEKRKAPSKKAISLIGQTTGGVPNIASHHATANFTEAAVEQELGLVPTRERRFIHQHQRVAPLFSARSRVKSAAPLAPAVSPLAQQASPAPSASFLGLGDSGNSIPPDTQGAVGPNHLMVTLNTQVGIQDRAGNPISAVDFVAFWQKLNTSTTTVVNDVTDPRIIYDPFANRWIFTATSDFETANAGILVGVTQTSDPTGNWNLYRIPSDTTGQQWSDFPSTGFNKNWIVVTANMFNVSSRSTLAFHNNIYVFNKADLYANGTGIHTTIAADPTLGSNIAPMISYDNAINTLYLLENFDGSQGQLQLFTVTGDPGNPVFQVGPLIQASNTWEEDSTPNPTNPNSNEIAFGPQLGVTRRIELDNAEFSNIVYRNGSIWAAQTVFLPGGNVTPTRASVQWWQIDPAPATPVIQQQGLIDDPTNTLFFAYPSIGVNKNNDVLIGYTRFSANQFASANYSFRSASDPVSTMRADTVLEPGGGVYAAGTGTNNRWGDYSATAPDPVNDTDLWTIQEFAAAQDGAGNSLFGTWWGRITPPGNAVAPPDLTLSLSHTGNFSVNTNGVYNLTVNNVGAGNTTQTITLTDTLPAGLSFVSGTGTGWSCSASVQIVTCTSSNIIAANTSSTVTLTVSVGSAAVGTITNSAQVSTPDDTNSSNNNATDQTTVTGLADLTISVSHTGNFQVGTNGVYNISVTNSGSATSSGAITVSDTLPTGLSFVSGTGTGWNCSANAQVVTCINNVALASNVSSSITLTVGVASAAFPSVTNTATVINSSDSNSTNNSSSNPTTVQGAVDLSIALSQNGGFTVGLNGSYTVTITNVGQVASSGAITVSDTLPVGLTFVSGVGSGWSCSASGQAVTCGNSNPLGANANSTFTLTVGVGSAAAPSVTNSVTVSNAGDSNAANNSASVQTSVATSTDLSLSGNAAVSIVNNIQRITYSLTAANGGPSPATGVVVSDTFPSSLTFLSASASQGTCTGTNTVSCNIGALANGGTATVTIVGTVAAAGSITNNVTISGGQTDANSANNTASFTSSIGNPTPAITGLSSTSIQSGSASFTLTVSGSGFINGSKVQWNGSARTTTFVNSGQLSATITAQDVVNPGTNSVSVFTPSPGGGTSNTLLFKVFGISSTNTASVNVGSNGTASTASGNTLPGITATLSHPVGGGAASIAVTTFQGNPTAGDIVDIGGGFVGLSLTNGATGDTINASFYYPVSITGSAETGLQLYFFNGTNWQVVKGSGGAAPVKNTANNLDGTTSGGRFTVTFDGTSSPAVSQLNNTVFAMTTIMSGDINGDAVIDASDLVLLANVLAGNVQVATPAADVFQDGVINAADLVTLANFLAGNIATLPVIPTTGAAIPANNPDNLLAGWSISDWNNAPSVIKRIELFPVERPLWRPAMRSWLAG